MGKQSYTTVMNFLMPQNQPHSALANDASNSGNLSESPHSFKLDDHHVFHKGKVALVCGNTFDMLAKSRFSDCFNFIGDK